jgi:hypothetical protein
VDDELDRIADRLALSDDAVPPKTNLETRDLVSPSKADQFDCFSVRLGQPQLLLRAASVDWESLVQKVALSLSILLLSAVAGLLVAKPALEIVGYQWTYIVLALIGFVWILWLRIPWIGFILICFAVYYSLTAGRWAMRTAASIEV